MMTLFKGVWTWAQGYIIPIVGTIIAMLIALVMSLNFLYTNKVEEVGTVKSELTTLQAEVVENNEQVKVDKANLVVTTKAKEKATQEYLDVKRVVEGHKGREEILRAKPALTEKMINKSFDKFGDEISCATGDHTACSKK